MKKLSFPFSGDVTIVIDGNQASLALAGGTLPPGIRVSTKLDGVAGRALQTEALTARLRDALPAIFTDRYEVIHRSNEADSHTVQIFEDGPLVSMHVQDSTVSFQFFSLDTIGSPFEDLMRLAALCYQISTIEGWQDYTIAGTQSRFTGAYELLRTGVLLWSLRAQQTSLNFPDCDFAVRGTVSQGESVLVSSDHTFTHASLATAIYRELSMSGEILVGVDSARFAETVSRAEYVPTAVVDQLSDGLITFVSRENDEDRAITLEVDSSEEVGHWKSYSAVGAQARSITDEIDFSFELPTKPAHLEDIRWALDMLSIYLGVDVVDEVSPNARKKPKATLNQTHYVHWTTFDESSTYGIWSDAPTIENITVGGRGDITFDAATGSAEIQYNHSRSGISYGRTDYLRAFAVVTETGVVVRILECGDENTNPKLAQVLRGSLELLVKDWLQTSGVIRTVTVLG